MDHFGDATHLIGDYISPIVAIELVDPVTGSKHADDYELPAEFSVRIPHCFDPSTVTKDQILLCFATDADEEWDEIDPEHYSLVEAMGGSQPYASHICRVRRAIL